MLGGGHQAARHCHRREREALRGFSGRVWVGSVRHVCFGERVFSGPSELVVGGLGAGGGGPACVLAPA